MNELLLDFSNLIIKENGDGCIEVNIPTYVKIRKYEVDIEKLQNCLREHKKNNRVTNKQIANSLNVPQTLVEHWFRTDDCFAIPREDIWFDLKKLLKIETEYFDKSIMTFEIKPNVFEMSDRYYDVRGISPTLMANGTRKIIIIDE